MNYTPEEGKVMIIRRPKSANKPHLDRAISAHLPNWDKPIARLEPKSPKSSLEPFAVNMGDAAESMKNPDRTHLTTQNPEGYKTQGQRVVMTSTVFHSGIVRRLQYYISQKIFS